jgi:hypothetical protein
MTLTVTIYKPRRGGRVHKEQVDIPNVYPEDADWFRQHGVKVSMEESGGQFAMYGDIGRFEEDGQTPSEVLVLSGSKNCQDTLRELRAACETALKEMSCDHDFQHTGGDALDTVRYWTCQHCGAVRRQEMKKNDD